jgi:prepilin-type N-terminal cleavage/methylation domain-containing protein
MKINLQKDNQKGFTLAELIIVVAIIAIISTISMFNSAKLNSSILLSDTAYEIGLIIRDVQISGLGVKVISNNGNATTSNQGIYFNILTPEKIIFFSDLTKNNKYDTGEESQIYNIENKRAGKILSICKITNNTICRPLSGGDANNLTNLSIIFKRPNPESYFYYNDGSSDGEYSGSVVVNIGFDPGDCRSVIIYKTGAVQIDRSFCPAII